MRIIDYLETRDEKILAEILEQYNAYIYKTILKYVPRNLCINHMEDLVQECRLWVIKAVNNFDPAKNGDRKQAHDYIFKYIRAAIDDYSAMHMFEFKLSVRVYTELKKYQKERNFRRCPGTEYISRPVSKKEMLLNLLSHSRNYEVAEIGGNTRNQELVSYNSFDKPEYVVSRCLELSVKALTAEQMELLNDRMEGKPFRSLANKYNLTGNAIRARYKNTIKILRKKYEESLNAHQLAIRGE